MSIKDDLHTLVDQLDDDQAVVALSYLRIILDAESAESEPRRKSLDERSGPLVVSGRELFAEKPRSDVMELAREQGVLPLSSFDDLLGEFWPEDESVDEFIAESWTLRRRDSHA